MTFLVVFLLEVCCIVWLSYIYIKPFTLGTDMEYEKDRIAMVNIVIATPGRLLQHMDENESFRCDMLQMLVIDEADRILDMGFTRQVYISSLILY